MSEILYLGRNFLAACTFYARTLSNNSVIAITVISRYNIRYFACCNYRYYTSRVTFKTLLENVQVGGKFFSKKRFF